MSTDIQRRPRSLAAAVAWLSRFATNGWQENVQFFAVCVFVLFLHLIAAPILKRAAADPEPDIVSPQETRASGAPQSTATVSGAATNGKAIIVTEKSEKKSADSLIFTDSKPKPAYPSQQKVPPPVIPANSESAPVAAELAKAVARPVTQSPQDSNTATSVGKGTESKAKSVDVPKSAAAAVPETPAAPVTPAQAQPTQASQKSAPQLSDLIGGGAPVAPATEDGPPAVKVFRAIP